jgi:VIT1/CCC1 family predicted Fe2+/Mn2+ transporter
MAIGEFVSVSSQADAEAADRQREAGARFEPRINRARFSANAREVT